MQQDASPSCGISGIRQTVPSGRSEVHFTLPPGFSTNSSSKTLGIGGGISTDPDWEDNIKSSCPITASYGEVSLEGMGRYEYYRITWRTLVCHGNGYWKIYPDLNRTVLRRPQVRRRSPVLYPFTNMDTTENDVTFRFRSTCTRQGDLPYG